MKVNYVLMYGTPYLKYREFETFEDTLTTIKNNTINIMLIIVKISSNVITITLYQFLILSLIHLFG